MNASVTVYKPGTLTVEKAQSMLAASRDLSEIKEIRDKAVALEHYYRAQRAGKQAAIDAAEIILDADRRIGELSRELPKEKPGPKIAPRVGSNSKASQLRDIGIEHQRASENEKIASLPKRDFDAYKKAEREMGRPPAPATAMKLAQMPEAQREKVFAKLEDDPDIRKAIAEVKATAADPKKEKPAKREPVTAQETSLLDSLIGLWNKATDEERESFMRSIVAVAIDDLDVMRELRESDSDYSHARLSAAETKKEYGPTRASCYTDFALLGGEVALARLGLDYRSTTEELKSAHRSETRRCHPDRGGSQQEMADVNAAVALISGFFTEMSKL